MSTKLEAVVGLLAGRKVEPALLEELDDPSSEASRFLEATRARSKALFAEPANPEPSRPSRPGRSGPYAVAFLAIASLVAVAAALHVIDRRFRLLEAELAARDLQAREDARRVVSILERLAEPRPEPGWVAPFEANLRRIEQEVETIKATPPLVPKADPSSARILEELGAIRHDLATAEKQAERRSEEVQAVVHDAARVMRLLINRFDPTLGPDKQPVFTPPRSPANGEPRRPKP